ncbi:hypothetical protein [Actinoplanes regularis]|uniref:hypothetical protein n=1 Tax=Actinoplanes regularis TaxID=52697 RepID=UPI0024A5FD1C|nr:hypothetical protein [Actinoplanes regularis]GLW34251.1 hypothetical protein Areg01_71880 [Actinoplanes regularis]
MFSRPRRLVAVYATALATALLLIAPGAPAAAATPDRFGFAYVKDPTVPAWTPLPAPYQFGSWVPGPLATGGKIATGRFLVRFPNIAFGSRGNVHVTAVARDGRFCEIVRWYASAPDEVIDVQCFKPGGAPADTPFTVLWNVNSGVLPAGVGGYASVQAISGLVGQSYNSSGGAVTVTGVAVGVYLVRFNGVGTPAGLSGDIQVTAQQPNAQPRRCKILRWGASGLDVLAYVTCHDPATGAVLNSDFTASFHRERSVYAAFAPPKYFGYIAQPGGGTTNYQYPLGVGANGIGSLGIGVYEVKYPILHQKETHAQVTAFGDGPSYCAIRDLWTDNLGDALLPVACFDNAGLPVNSGLTASFSSSV